MPEGNTEFLKRCDAVWDGDEILDSFGKPAGVMATERCPVMVHPAGPYYSTPCGTFCCDHMAEHVDGCRACAEDFPAAIVPSEPEPLD